MASTESHWASMQPRVTTICGDRLPYRVAGKGPLLLLVHGMAGTSVTWRHVMPALAERFRVVAVDNRDAGKSDTVRSSY